MEFISALNVKYISVKRSRFIKTKSSGVMLKLPISKCKISHLRRRDTSTVIMSFDVSTSVKYLLVKRKNHQENSNRFDSSVIRYPPFMHLLRVVLRFQIVFFLRMRRSSIFTSLV